MATFYPKSVRTNSYSERMKFTGEGVEALYELFDVLWISRDQEIGTVRDLSLSPVAQDIFDMLMVDDIPVTIHTDQYEYLPESDAHIEHEQKIILRGDEILALQSLVSFWLNHSEAEHPSVDALASFIVSTADSNKKVHRDILPCTSVVDASI